MHQLGFLNQATSEYLAAIEADSRMEEAYSNLGIIYASQRNYVSAKEAFSTALSLNPKRPSTLNGVGTVFYAQGYVKEAKEKWLEAVAIDPKFASAYYNIGNACESEKNFAEALSVYAKTISMAPNMADAYYRMGNVYYRQHHYPQASVMLRRAVELAPDGDFAEDAKRIERILEEDFAKHENAPVGWASTQTSLNMTMVNDKSNIHLNNGSRIIFFGDSITKFGEEPNGYISLMRKAVRNHHPKESIELIGAGIGGNRVLDLQRRMRNDVIEKKPTIVVIYIGINDVWFGEQDPGLATPPQTFRMRLDELATSIAGNGASIVLCTPTVIGERKIGTNQLDAQLDTICSIVREIALHRGYVLCDLRKGFSDYLAVHNHANLNSGILTSDKVHLNNTGNILVSKLLLETLGESPQ